MGEEDKIKELEKKFNDLRCANAGLRERLYMMENKIDRIQAKKEVDYVKIIESLLEKIVTSKDLHFTSYIDTMTEMLKLVGKKE